MNSAWILLAALMLGPLAPRTGVAQPSRAFDTNGDGQPEVTIFDTNGDGFFEWPTGTKTVPGLLEFTDTDRIAFRGTTTIQTGDGLFYAEGTELVTLPDAPLQKLVVTASRGNVGGSGLLDLAVTGDVSITAYGFIFLFGNTRVGAGGTIALQSKTAAISLAPSLDPLPPDTFALLAGKQLNMTSKGNNAGIRVNGLRVGARVVNFMVQTSKTLGGSFVLDQGALVTTNPALTGLPGTAGNVTLSNQRSGITVRRGSTVDSGKDLILRAQYISTTFSGWGFCVRESGTIRARDDLGIIDTRGLSAEAVRDASGTVEGRVVGRPILEGLCF